MGFTGVGDLLGSVLGLNNNIVNLSLLGITVGSALAALQEFINNYIYTPAEGIFILFIVTGLDVFMGIWRAIKLKEGLEGNKISRAAVRFIIQVAFVGIMSGMHEVFTYMIYHWMIDTVLIIFTLSTLWSFLRNSNRLGFITDDQYKALNSVIGIKEFLSRIGNKNKQ